MYVPGIYDVHGGILAGEEDELSGHHVGHGRRVVLPRKRDFINYSIFFKREETPLACNVVHCPEKQGRLVRRILGYERMGSI